MDIDNCKLPNLPRAGAICYAMTMDVLTYKVPRVGNHMAGVYDTALWSTDQMKAYAKAAIAQCSIIGEKGHVHDAPPVVWPEPAGRLITGPHGLFVSYNSLIAATPGNLYTRAQVEAMLEAQGVKP